MKEIQHTDYKEHHYHYYCYEKLAKICRMKRNLISKPGFEQL